MQVVQLFQQAFIQQILSALIGYIVNYLYKS